MTNPTFRGFDTAGATVDGGTTPSITIPSSATGNFASAPQVGDYALLIVTWNISSTMTPPSGWSLFASDSTNSNDFLYVFEKVLTAGDIGSTLQCTSTPSGAGSASVLVFAGSNGAIDALTSAISSTNDTTLSAPAITPVLNDCLRFYIFSMCAGTTGVAVGASTPTGFTEDIDNTTSGIANSRRLGHAIGHQALTGQAGVSQGAASATAATSCHEVVYSFTIGPSQGITVAAQAASGSGAAQDPAAAATVSPPEAAGTGGSQDPATAIGVPAATAVGAGDATFDTTGQSVDLELVGDNPIFGSGAALDPAGILLVVRAESAGGAGQAFDGFVPPLPVLDVLADFAAGVGEALDATVDIFIPPVPKLFRFDSPTQSFVERPFSSYGELPLGPAVQRVVGLTVLRVGGQWRATLAPSAADEQEADRYYMGGHFYVLDEDAAAELVAAGFGANLTQIQ